LFLLSSSEKQRKKKSGQTAEKWWSNGIQYQQLQKLYARRSCYSELLRQDQ